MRDTSGETMRANRARTGHYAAQGVRDPDGALWHFEATGPVSSPCLSAGLLCVGAADEIWGLDPLTGREQWHRKGMTDFLAYNGVIYAMREGQALCLLDARTGDDLRQWAAPPGAACHAVDGGTAYLMKTPDGSRRDNSRLTALDLRTGRERWSFETEHYPIVSKISFGGNALCFFEEGDGHAGWSVYALEKRTGALRWQHLSMAVGNAAPIANRRVFYTDNDGSIRGLNLSTGVEEWNYSGEDDWDEEEESEEPPSGSAYTEPALDGRNVYFRTIDDDLLCAVNRRTRRRRWALSPEEPDPMTAPLLGPSVANSIAYFPIHDTLYAVDTDKGEQLWTFKAYDVISSEAVIADGVLFLTIGQRLYALAETQPGGEHNP